MTQNSPDTIVRAARLAERTIQGLTRYGSARFVTKECWAVPYAFRRNPCWNAPGNWNLFSSPSKETVMRPLSMFCTMPFPNALCFTADPAAMPDTSACGAGVCGWGTVEAGGTKAGR